MIFLSKRKLTYSFFILLCILLNFLLSCTKPVIRSEKIEIPEERPVIDKSQRKEDKEKLIERCRKLLNEIQHTKKEKDDIIALTNMDADRRKRDYDRYVKDKDWHKKIAFAKNRVKYIKEIYITLLDELKDTAKKLRYLDYSAEMKNFLVKYEEAQNDAQISKNKLSSIEEKIKYFLNKYWSEKADEKQAIAAVKEAEGIQKEYDILVKMIKTTEKELAIMGKERKNTDYLKEYLSESKKLLEEYEEIKREAIISKNRLDSINKEKDDQNVYDALIKMIKITEKETKDHDRSAGKTKSPAFKTAKEEKEKRLNEYYEMLQKKTVAPKNKLDKIEGQIDIYEAREKVSNIRGNYKEANEYKRMANEAKNEAKYIQKEYDALVKKIKQIEKERKNTDFLKEYLSESKKFLGRYEDAKKKDKIARDKLNTINEQTDIYLRNRASAVKSWSEKMDKYEGKRDAAEKEIKNNRKEYYVLVREFEIIEKELGALGYSGEKLSRSDPKKLLERYRDVRKEVKAAKNELDRINRQIYVYFPELREGKNKQGLEKDKGQAEVIKKTSKDLQEQYDNLVKELLKIKNELNNSDLSMKDRDIIETGMTADKKKERLLDSYEGIQDEIKTFKNKLGEIKDQINIYTAREKVAYIRKDQEKADEYKEEKEYFYSQRKSFQEEYDALLEKIKPIEKRLEITERIIRSIEKKLGYPEEELTRSGAKVFLESYRKVRKAIKVTRDKLDRINRQLYVNFPEQESEEIKQSLEKDKGQIDVIKKAAEGLHEKYDDLAKELWEIKKELKCPDYLKIDRNILEMEIAAEEKNERLLERYEGLQSEMKVSKEERYKLDILQAEGMIYSDLQRTAKHDGHQDLTEEYKRKAKAARNEKRRLQEKYDNLKKELEMIKKEF